MRPGPKSSAHARRRRRPARPRPAASRRGGRARAACRRASARQPALRFSCTTSQDCSPGADRRRCGARRPSADVVVRSGRCRAGQGAAEGEPLDAQRAQLAADHPVLAGPEREAAGGRSQSVSRTRPQGQQVGPRVTSLGRGARCRRRRPAGRLPQGSRTGDVAGSRAGGRSSPGTTSSLTPTGSGRDRAVGPERRRAPRRSSTRTSSRSVLARGKRRTPSAGTGAVVVPALVVTATRSDGPRPGRRRWQLQPVEGPPALPGQLQQRAARRRRRRPSRSWSSPSSTVAGARAGRRPGARGGGAPAAARRRRAARRAPGRRAAARCRSAAAPGAARASTSGGPGAARPRRAGGGPGGTPAAARRAMQLVRRPRRARSSSSTASGDRAWSPGRSTVSCTTSPGTATSRGRRGRRSRRSRSAVSVTRRRRVGPGGDVDGLRPCARRAASSSLRRGRS